MRISEIAEKSGLNAKTLRFYEEKGLVIPKRRQDNGYREYETEQIAELTLIKQARAAGFSLSQCQELINLYRDPNRHSEDVKARAKQRVQELEQQIETLRQVQQQLQALIASCPGNKQADCPIIETFIGRSKNTDVRDSVK